MLLLLNLMILEHLLFNIFDQFVMNLNITGVRDGSLYKSGMSPLFREVEGDVCEAHPLHVGVQIQSVFPILGLLIDVM